MNVPTYIACALSVYALTVILIDTSFMDKFVWPWLRHIIELFSLFEDWRLEQPHEQASESYLLWRGRVIHSESWILSTTGTLLSCRVCQAVQFGTLICWGVMGNILNADSVVNVLSWTAITHLLNGRK